MDDRFELALDVHCSTGESPVWLPREQQLIFVDIPGRRIHRFDPQSRALSIMEVDEDIGCVAPVRDGGFVAGMRSGVWLLDESGAKRRLLASNPENIATSRFNDGRVDPRGRLLVGTLDESKKEGRAGLYRYDRRGLVRLTEGLMTSNGTAFSPDGRTLYYSDTPRFVIYRYEYDPDTGRATQQREFARLEPTPDDRGRPDGAAVDVEGCYWTALYEGFRLHRYGSDGRLIAQYPIPARYPTMPAFGGADLRTLFVTTARDKADNSGGGLYAMRVETPGLPTTAFDPEA